MKETTSGNGPDLAATNRIMALHSENPTAVLREKFHLSGFRHGQKEIIDSIMSGRDVLAVLPTGGGKSLCYQYPAVVKNELVIVISPLIALMKDQVDGLRRLGIPAACLHSGQDEIEKREIFHEMGSGGTFVLYLSPERAQKEGFHRWIQHRKIALFAIDEAHCVSQWGHDFREEYSQLGILKKLRPDVPVLSLTASATPLVLQDIARQLNLKKHQKHVHGFYRKNLYYQVEPCGDDNEKVAFLHQSLKQFPDGRIIVYCGTRKQTEEVANFLQDAWPGVGFYHAGLTNEKRTEVQNAYASGALRILVATNAFGMGIDHPDVRLVVHFQMPANIDSLYQEMGRAGRDGKPSSCLMLYARKDKGLQSYFIQKSEAPSHIKSSRWNTLDALVAYAEGGECRHSEILTYYQDSQRIERCGHCDVCDPLSERRIKPPVVQKPAKSGKKSSADAAAEAETWDPMDDFLFNDLKAWRKEKAKELDVPAFVILSDRSLRDLVRKKPRQLEQLEKVHGFGKTKTERFGAEVLRLLLEGFVTKGI